MLNPGYNEIMNLVIAVIAPGAMGAAVGKRLADHGVKVLTSLAGRSASTIARAGEAGMIGASDEAVSYTHLDVYKRQL